MFLYTIERNQELLIKQRDAKAATKKKRKRKESGTIAKVAAVPAPSTPAEEPPAPEPVVPSVFEDLKVVAPDPLPEPPKPSSMYAMESTPIPGGLSVLRNVPLETPKEEPDMNVVDVITKMIGVPVPVDLHTQMAEYLKRNKGKDGPKSLKQLAFRCLRIGFAALNK